MRMDQAPQAGVGRRRVGQAVVALAWVIITALGAQLGILAPVDGALETARFTAATRPASGQLVFVEIDASSLAEVGVWPWPRHLHAQLLDAALDLGATEVVFDIDFSTASNAADDQAFATALERAGGYAYLAAFQQASGTSGQLVLSRPIEQFSRFASPVLVNVDAETGGLLRSVPGALQTPDGEISSLARAIGGVAGQSSGPVTIDFSIDLATIPRVSAIDLLNGSVQAAQIAGKHIVIGASAIELRDLFAVPRFGVVPGPLVQIAAAETIKANRVVTEYGPWPALVMILLVGLVGWFQSPKMTRWREASLYLSAALAAEGAAFGLFSAFAISFNTAPLHFGLLGLLAINVLNELAIRRRGEARQQRQRQTMQQVLDRVVTDNFDGIIVLDDAGIVIAASLAASQILRSQSDLIGQKAAAVLPSELYGQLSPAGTVKNGECECEIARHQRTLEFVITHSQVPDVDDAKRLRTVSCLTFKDTTERRQRTRRLAYLASHDSVTGALSRQTMVEQIDASLSRNEKCSVAVIRLTRLQQINETFGHDVGDRLLSQVLERLQVATATLPARLTGDTFAVEFVGIDGGAQLDRGLEQIIAALQKPFMVDGHELVVDPKLGVANSSVSHTDAVGLLRHADIALAQSRTSSNRRYAIFEPEFETRIEERQTLDVALRKALQDNEFYLLFQPQIDLATGQFIGVEALVRWNSSQLGIVSPGAFIPLVEETGLIVELGNWVLVQACKQIANCDWSGRLAVNVSVVQFQMGDVVAAVKHALQISGLSPDRLDIEITESLLVDSQGEVLEALATLRQMGVGIAIDDFGTGYSSLSYLARLPVDKLKIDQSFVRNLPDPDSLAIVETVIAMAHRLRKTVVAEGIETEQQRAILKNLACDVGQGYLFARPTSLIELGIARQAA